MATLARRRWGYAGGTALYDPTPDKGRTVTIKYRTALARRSDLWMRQRCDGEAAPSRYFHLYDLLDNAASDG